MYHEHNPHVYTIAYIHRHGIQQYEELLRDYAKPRKISDAEIAELITKFKKLIEEVVHEKDV